MGGHRRLAVERLDVAQSDEFHEACKLTSASAVHPSSINTFKHCKGFCLFIQHAGPGASEGILPIRIFYILPLHSEELWPGRLQSSQMARSRRPMGAEESWIGMTGIDWFEVMQG